MKLGVDYDYIPISSIEIGERARTSIGDTTDIQNSATGFAGQIQSLAVKRLSSDVGRFKLLAGARRTSAFSLAGLTHVLVRIYPQD